jgi:hypothetical protein
VLYRSASEELCLLNGGVVDIGTENKDAVSVSSESDRPEGAPPLECNI